MYEIHIVEKSTDQHRQCVLLHTIKITLIFRKHLSGVMNSYICVRVLNEVNCPFENKMEKELIG